MKILMLNNEYPPLGGGTGIVNKEILELLALNPNIKVDLITGSKENNKKITQLSENIRIIFIGLNNKNIHHASNFELIKYPFLAFFQAIKLQQKEKYDFSFAWSTIPAGFVSFLLKLIYRLPYIVRIGGSDIPGYENRYKNIYKIITPIIKLIWKNSKVLITKCMVEMEMVLAIDPKLNLKIISNGIDSEKFKPKEKHFGKILHIICTARLIKHKGQDLLIKALAKLKNRGIIFKLVLVGDGDEMNNYRQLAIELDVMQLVEFKGYVPRELMELEYQKADIFVLPSCNEGMSNSLIEAMACGLPVVVTNVGGTKELVVEGGNGYIFQVGDEEKLISILEKIAKQPLLLTDMGKKSRKIAESLSWQSIANEYYSMFKSLHK